MCYLYFIPSEHQKKAVHETAKDKLQKMLVYPSAGFMSCGLSRRWRDLAQLDPLS
jgi:hypothetical protein